MEIKTGHINLFPLLAHVAEDPALPPILAKNKKKDSSPYRKKVIDVLKGNVPNDRGGWYLWGRFNDAGWWESLYVGKTKLGKTSNLFVRLQTELQEECVAIFATVYGRYQMTAAIKKLYGNHAKKTKKDYYGNGDGIQRNLRKTGAHFVIWVTADEVIGDGKIRSIENELISIYRPGFNMKRPGVGQSIPSEYTAEVRSLVDAIDREIKEILAGGRHQSEIRLEK